MAAEAPVEQKSGGMAGETEQAIKNLFDVPDIAATGGHDGLHDGGVLHHSRFLKLLQTGSQTYDLGEYVPATGSRHCWWTAAGRLFRDALQVLLEIVLLS